MNIKYIAQMLLFSQTVIFWWLFIRYFWSHLKIYLILHAEDILCEFGIRQKFPRVWIFWIRIWTGVVAEVRGRIFCFLIFLILNLLIHFFWYFCWLLFHNKHFQFFIVKYRIDSFRLVYYWWRHLLPHTSQFMGQFP